MKEFFYKRIMDFFKGGEEQENSSETVNLNDISGDAYIDDVFNVRISRGNMGTNYKGFQ